ncbi:MAG: LysM peptidoglycan-binding domain-containing protein, partial [Bacteroidota bacterium]
MKLNIKKHSTSSHVSYILLCTLYLILNAFTAYSQEKPAGGILKSKNVTTINGVKYYLHTVEKGQTLFAIAKGYELSLNDIVIENPEAIDGIKPGQVLKVPIKKAKKIESAPVTNGGNYVLHQVEAGQTLYSISKQYNTTVEKIKILNPELNEGLKG